MKAYESGAPLRAGIVGLGLIGGSFAAALRAARPDWTVIGYDVDASAVRRARDRRLTHEIAETCEAAIGRSDLIVLAAPVRTILAIVARLPTMVAGEATVIDVGSTKGQVVDAMSRLPARIQAVGGHPMTGALTAGTVEPSPTLFEGRRFVLTPTPSTRPETMTWLTNLLRDFKAEVIEMTASAHDDAVALVSHLPYLLPVPLLQVLDQAGEPARALVAGGFRSRVQGAGADIAMWHDILMTNRRAIAAAVRAYGERLAALESLLLDGTDDELREVLARAARSADAVTRGS